MTVEDFYQYTDDNIQTIDIPSAVDSLIGIERFQNLRVIRAADRNLNSISKLKYLKELRIINISYNNISNLSPLKDMKNLHTLRFINNPVSDIGVLKTCINLSDIAFTGSSISYANIRDISDKIKLIFVNGCLYSDEFISNAIFEERINSLGL